MNCSYIFIDGYLFFYLGWFCHGKKLVFNWVVFIDFLRLLGSLSYLERFSLVEEYEKLSCGFFFLKINLSIYFWLCWVFVAERGLSLVARAGATLCCSARASHCDGFSCCRARTLGARASVVVARALSSCGSRALESSLSSCGTQA